MNESLKDSSKNSQKNMLSDAECKSHSKSSMKQSFFKLNDKKSISMKSPDVSPNQAQTFVKFNGNNISSMKSPDVSPIIAHSFNRLHSHNFTSYAAHDNTMNVCEKTNTLGFDDFNKVSRIFSENNNRMDAAMIFENSSSKSIHSKKKEDDVSPNQARTFVKFNGNNISSMKSPDVSPIIAHSFNRLHSHNFTSYAAHDNTMNVCEKTNTIGFDDLNKVSRIFSENNSRMDEAMIFENFSSKSIHSKKKEEESSIINSNFERKSPRNTNCPVKSNFNDKTAIVRRNTDIAPQIKIN